MRKTQWLTSTMAALMLLSFVGCNGSGSENSGLTAQNPVEDTKVHYVANTLHKTSYDYAAGKTFVKDGKTEYKIIVSDDSYAMKAAAYISAHVYAVTGVALEMISKDTALLDAYSVNDHYIVMDCDDIFTKASLQMPADDIGETGYYIKTTGNSVFIQAYGADGYQLGALAFLRAVVGYDMLGTEIYSYSLDGTVLPQMELIERPDYDYRVGCDAGNRYGMGFTDNNIILTVEGHQWHNSFDYLPPETYMSIYPEWYSDRAQQDLVTSVEPGYGQLCYTAHGDDESLQRMIDTLYVKLKSIVDSRTDLSNITITQQDSPVACQCDSCTEMKNQYGSNAAAIIQFVNAVDDKLQADLEAEALASGKRKREFYISFFAYRATVDAPVRKNADGSYTPIDGIQCNEHVGVVLAPITASYTHSFYEEKNASHAANVTAWGAVTGRLYMWLYETNFKYYFFPLASWYDAVETLRFCKLNGASYCYSQSQWDNPTRTGFSFLKDYINSKAQFDVNINVNEVIDKYFEEYFMDAAEPMREFFDGIQIWYDYLVEKYSTNLSGGYNDAIFNQAYWPKRLLDGWMELIDDAYAAVEKYCSTDPLLYNSLLDRINIESVFPRYALLSFYGGYINDLTEQRQVFKEDVLRLGFTHKDESNDGLLEHLWSEWGV